MRLSVEDRMVAVARHALLLAGFAWGAAEGPGWVVLYAQPSGGPVLSSIRRAAARVVAELGGEWLEECVEEAGELSDLSVGCLLVPGGVWSAASALRVLWAAGFTAVARPAGEPRWLPSLIDLYSLLEHYFRVAREAAAAEVTVKLLDSWLWALALTALALASWEGAVTPGTLDLLMLPEVQGAYLAVITRYAAARGAARA